MPLPDRLRAWMNDDVWNGRIVQALMEGVAAGLRGDKHLGEAASDLGYQARSAQGDAFEEGYQFGETKRFQEEP